MEIKKKDIAKKLKPGMVFRRENASIWSKAVDRDLKELLEVGTLKKAATGLYYVPRKSVYGVLPPDDKELVAGFLKDPNFLLTSPNNFNTLGLGTTQLYNSKIVYNRKRHGKHTLAGKTFDFRIRHAFPKKLNDLFLFVDLVNNIDYLAENKQLLLQKIKAKAQTLDRTELKKQVLKYGTERTKKFFKTNQLI
ncbi:hypothetical protein [Rhizosphaericola mali]|uniref:Type IV toxin-antitoxin system AbiEi family antitoxin domain-containing protein n=1 Tax=Rhizosphaericola mali TaxID=2545455 RepID=A0A5P2G9R1_9BACT|nr:hypothetical protein [Rhizosphaericola mali]QES91049.1 hypothetical protein E0W69_020255 [Rhizosphaericola mali]